MWIWFGMLLAIFVTWFMIPDDIGKRRKDLIFLTLSYAIVVFIVGSRSPHLSNSTDLFNYYRCFGDALGHPLSYLTEVYSMEEGYLVLKSSLTAGTVAPEVVEPEVTTTEEVTTEATPEDVTTATPDATETEAVTTTEEVTTEASSEPDTNVVPTPPTKDSNAFTYVIIVAVAVISMITLAAIVTVKKENN